MPAEPPAGVTPTYAQQYRRCGKLSCPLCAGGGRGHGPYWYAYWREEGRARSKYLGKHPPPGVVVTAAPASLPEGPARPPAPPHPAALGVARAIWPQPEAQAAPHAGPTLRVRALGGFALWRREQHLDTGRWERRREGALLKWLLSAPGHRLTRDEVAERFWPAAAPERGMANLRVLAHRLRAALGEAEGGEGGALRYDGEVLALAPGAPGWLDADAFEAAARAALAGQDAGACRAALALYGGDYLPGDAYEEWALGAREALRGRRLALLLHLAALCGVSGEAEEAEDCLRAALATNPCREEAAVALMRLLAEGGRPGQALRAYRRLAEALREDLGLAPERETQALARALAAQQAAATMPAIPVPDTPPSNLPAALSSFVGRRRELVALRALLLQAGAGERDEAEDAPCRLLTLTGPGGVGKTRLALRLADDRLDAPGACPDGAWLVELASLADPALVSKAVAQTLGIQEEAARPLTETLVAHLRSKRLLLLLDNCEHLLDACADLAATLLSACPGLRILATSRAPLGVPGEVAWPVPALSLPPAEGAGAAGSLLESEAARLFLDRVRMQRPELLLTEANAGTMARICRQLDGIPLALELAAARAGVLSPEQIADRLVASLGLLTGGPRTAPQRQRTLRATLNWSYQLLTDPERTLLRRLAIFAGGCTLEAAEAVCAGEGLAAEEVLDLLQGLVRHSLAQVEEREGGELRYRLLETVRQYAGERLAESSERVTLEERHAAFFAALAEQAEPQVVGAEQMAWLAQLDREHDNLRAALQWARQIATSATADGHALETGLRLAGALWRFWHIRGHLVEGRRWLATLLALPCPARDAARAAYARVLVGAGMLAYDQGEYECAAAFCEEGLAHFRALSHPQGCAETLHVLGTIMIARGDLDRAADLYSQSLNLRRAGDDTWGLANLLNSMGVLEGERSAFGRATALYEESLALHRRLRNRRGVGVVLHNLAGLASHHGDYVRAAGLYEEAAALSDELADPQGRAGTLVSLAEVYWHRGDRDRAATLGKESLALFRRLEDLDGIAQCLLLGSIMALGQGEREQAEALGAEALALYQAEGYQVGVAAAWCQLGRVARDRGDLGRAAACYREGLPLYHSQHHLMGVAECLEGCASAAAGQGRMGDATRLQGAVAALRAALGAPGRPGDRVAVEQEVAALRATLGASFAAAWAEGQALPLGEAIALAMGEPSAP